MGSITRPRVGHDKSHKLTATMDPTNADLRRILESCRTIAVVGLSADWNRPSYFAAKYMQTAG